VADSFKYRLRLDVGEFPERFQEFVTMLADRGFVLSLVAGRGRLMLPQNCEKSRRLLCPTPASGIAKKALVTPYSGQLVDNLSCSA
jgi:hypothetical protein